jgi:hypothetical protein
MIVLLLVLLLFLTPCLIGKFVDIFFDRHKNDWWRHRKGV